jgi:hypothetical protein
LTEALVPVIPTGKKQYSTAELQAYPGIIRRQDISRKKPAVALRHQISRFCAAAGKRVF